MSPHQYCDACSGIPVLALAVDGKQHPVILGEPAGVLLTAKLSGK